LKRTRRSPRTPGAGGTGPASAPVTDDEPTEPYARFTSRITIADVADLVFTRAITSAGAQAIAGFLITIGLLAALAGAAPDLWVALLIIGAAVGTGFVLLPFIWWSYVAVPEMLLETIEADPSGMRIHVGDREVTHPWTIYQRAVETDKVFILNSRVVRAQVFAKRDATADEVDDFRAILREVELLDASAQPQPLRSWIGFLVGGATAVIWLLLLRAFVP
jgi:hypothetical protein